MNTHIEHSSPPQNKKPSLLLVDDDHDFLAVLTRAMTKRGFSVNSSDSAENALEKAMENIPDFAVVDLRMDGSSGLVLVRKFNELGYKTKVVVLTGYASIATAIEAIKLGAIHYLAKPVEVDEIIRALQGNFENQESLETYAPLSVNRMEWEHIQNVLNTNEGNISATARALNMHRRTLQRKLKKYPK